MPSTSGRVRMPHNNRVSTSGALKTSDIWSKTIGHNPYAADHEREDAESAAANAERARGLLELARHQNASSNPTSGNNDDFVKKMFLGLKSGKKRRSVEEETGLNGKIRAGVGADGGDILSSSSEDEFVEEDVKEANELRVEKTEKGRKSRKKKKKEKKRLQRKEKRK